MCFEFSWDKFAGLQAYPVKIIIETLSRNLEHSDEIGMITKGSLTVWSREYGRRYYSPLHDDATK